MASQSASDDVLYIGDYVCLYHVDTKGFVYSSQSRLVVGVNHDMKNPEIGNPSMLIFQVLTQNRYKANKAFRKVEAKAAAQTKNFALQAQVVRNKKAAETETKDNVVEQKRVLGKAVRYGETIQLRHVFTGKFLHVNPAQTSALEPNHYKAELIDRDGKSAQFEMSPRYKIKSSGESVRQGDLVSFGSIKTKGHYLHSSRSVFDETSTYINEHELNVSAMPSGFTIYKARNFSLTTKEAAAAVKGGSIVRLFHKEKEAFVAAEGQFKSPITENVHLRVRPLHIQRRTTGPPRSAITAWTVVKETSNYDSGEITWDDKVRLQHLTTRQFLIIRPDESVGLTSDEQDSLTLLKLHPVRRRSDKILDAAYARVQSVKTANETYTRIEDAKSSDGQSSEKIKTLVFSKAELKQLKGSPSMSYEDAFAVHLVTDNEVLSINYIAGQVPFLRKLQDDCRNGNSFTDNQSLSIFTALTELENHMVENGQPVKHHQRLLRDFKIVDTIINVLKEPAEKSASKEFMNQVHSKCYSLLQKYLNGGSRKNEMYIARHYDFLVDQLFIEGPVGLNATYMLMELLKDNSYLVDSVTEEQFDKFVGLMLKNKNYRYLRLFETLCIVNDIPIADKQNFIVDKWLVEPLGKNEDVVYFLAMGQDIGLKEGLVYLSIDNKRSWMPVPDFCKVNGETSDQYQFLQYQLLMFGCLCKGRNTYAMDVIVKKLKLFTMEMAFICLEDETVANGIRAMFCKNIADIFVDIPGNSSNSEVEKLIFIYEDIVSLEEMKAGKTVNLSAGQAMPVQYMKELKTWVEKFLSQHAVMRASESAENNFIEQVLSLVRNLADFGYYESKELVSILQQILAILDGRTDLPFPIDITDKEIVATNKESLDEFRKVSRFVENPKNKAVVDAKIKGCKIVELLFRYQFDARLYRYIQEFKSANAHDIQTAEMSAFFNRFSSDFHNNQNLHKLCWRKCAAIFHDTEWFEETFAGILLDLQNYRYHQLTTQSLQLLNDFFTPHDRLFQKSSAAKLTLNMESAFVYRKVASDVPNLKILKFGKLSKENTNQIMDMMFDLTKMCCLENDTREPHYVNQQLIYNNDILGDAYDLMERLAKTTHATDQIKGSINKSVLRFLKSFSKNYPVVQDRLFDRLDFLFTITAAETELGETINEIFAGNTPNCLRVRSDHIQKMVELYARSYHPVWISLLSTLACSGRFPIKRNQNLVLKALMHYEESISILTETTLDQKIEILRTDELSAKDKFELKLRFANVINLLSTCAMGENKAAESICQCTLVLDDLLELVNVEELCTGLRGPFVRFLTYVYLNSNSPTALKDIEKFGGDERFVSLIYRLDSTLNEANTIVTTDPRQAVELLRQPPGIIHTTYLDETHEKKEVLNYVCDAIIPITEVIFAKHFKKSLKLSTEQLENFVRTLCHYGQNVTPCLSQTAQRLDLLNTIRLATVATHQYIEAPKDLQKRMEIKSESRKKYDQKYKAEVELNDKFHHFTKNMWAAYQGKNTVRGQLGLPIDKIYVRLDTEERLPIGNDFQRFVNSFLPKNSEKRRLYEVRGVMLHLKNSINNLRLSENAKIKQAELDLKLMQILRAMVHNEMVRLPGSKLTDPNTYGKVMDDVVATQNFLNDQGVVDCVLPHLGRSEEAIVKEVLYFFNLLYRGTDQTPMAFVHFVQENHHEAFFVMVKRRLETAANLIKEQKFLLARYSAIVEQTEKLIEAEVDLMESKPVGYGNAEKEDKPEILPDDNDQTQLITDDIELAELNAKTNKNDPDKFTIPLKPPYLTIYRDTSYINVLLNMLQSLCDGQYTDAQNLVRTQANARVINLVAHVCDFLALLCSNINGKYVGMTSNCFDTVGEFVRGNKFNQSTAFDNKVIDSINAVLLNATFKDCTDEQKLQLLFAMAHLLMYMTEENHMIDSGAPEASVVMGAVDKDGVWRTARECYRLGTKGPRSLRESYLTTGFIYFSILKRAADLKLWDSKAKKSEFTWGYYEKGSMSVEFLKDKVIQRFHFRVVDQKTMREEVEESINWKVDRLNPGAKMRQYMGWAGDAVIDVKAQRTVNRNPITGFLARNWKTWNYLSFVTAAITQLAILAVWDGTNETTPILRPSLQEEFNVIIMKGVGSVHNIVSFCLFFSFFFSNFSGFISWKNGFVARFKQRLIKFHLMSDRPIKMPPNYRLEVSPFSGTTIYYLVFIGMSLAGSFLSPAFNSFHLLQLIRNNQLLGRVIQAITMNARPLMLIGILALIITYLHALVGFLMLRRFYQQNNLFCDTLIQCSLTTLREGLLYAIKRIDYPIAFLTRKDFPSYLGVVLFGIAFFISITMVGLNVIFGMIVDAFKNLRIQKAAFELDMQSRCFICERNAYEFEQKGIVSSDVIKLKIRYTKSFEYHQKMEHNVMAYVYLLVHISDTDQQRLSAAEMHIDSLVKDDNYTFFPTGMAISLDGVKTSNAASTIEAQLSNKADGIIAQLNDQGKRRAAAIKAMEAAAKPQTAKPKSAEKERKVVGVDEEFERLTSAFVAKMGKRAESKRAGKPETTIVDLESFLLENPVGSDLREDGPIGDQPTQLEGAAKLQLPFRPKTSAEAQKRKEI